MEVVLQVKTLRTDMVGRVDHVVAAGWMVGDRVVMAAHVATYRLSQSF